MNLESLFFLASPHNISQGIWNPHSAFLRCSQLVDSKDSLTTVFVGGAKSPKEPFSPKKDQIPKVFYLRVLYSEGCQIPYNTGISKNVEMKADLASS